MTGNVAQRLDHESGICPYTRSVAVNIILESVIGSGAIMNNNGSEIFTFYSQVWDPLLLQVWELFLRNVWDLPTLQVCYMSLLDMSLLQLTPSFLRASGSNHTGPELSGLATCEYWLYVSNGKLKVVTFPLAHILCEDQG